MLLRCAALGLALVACAEPVVEMQIQLPSNAESFDASCITGVSVYALGASFMQDEADHVETCRELTPTNRLGGIHDQIRGQFTLTIPDSGLSGIQVFGWSAASPCDAEFGSDLVFEASAPYIGQDRLELPLSTTLSCARQDVRVRPVELFALLSGATPSSDNCAAARIPATDTQAWTSVGQMRERAIGTAVDFFGGMRGSYHDSEGVATFSAATTGLDGKSCLAYDVYGASGYAASCTMSGAKVCAGADEIEAPYVRTDIADAVFAFDDALITKWDGVVIVSVWDSGTPRRPLAGATVEVDAADGEVVYVDAPPAGSTQLIRRSERTTGASGLALVFTNRLADVKVTANGSSRNVTLATPDFWLGASLVVMP